MEGLEGGWQTISSSIANSGPQKDEWRTGTTAMSSDRRQDTIAQTAKTFNAGPVRKVYGYSYVDPYHLLKGPTMGPSELHSSVKGWPSLINVCMNGMLSLCVLCVRSLNRPKSLWIDQPWWEHEVKVIKNVVRYAATWICSIRWVPSSTCTSIYIKVSVFPRTARSVVYSIPNTCMISLGDII